MPSYSVELSSFYRKSVKIGFCLSFKLISLVKTVGGSNHTDNKCDNKL